MLRQRQREWIIQSQAQKKQRHAHQVYGLPQAAILLTRWIGYSRWDGLKGFVKPRILNPIKLSENLRQSTQISDVDDGFRSLSATKGSVI